MDSNDQQYLDRVLEVTRRYVSTSVKMSNDMHEYQNSLELEKIFDPSVLLNPVERSQFRDKLKKLVAMFDGYKKYYQTYVVNLTRDMLVIHSELPPEQQKEVTERFMASVQARISEQSCFYTLRQRWVDAVYALLDLMDSSKDCYFDGQSYCFDKDTDIERFNTIMQEINDVSEMEQKIQQARMERVGKNMNILGS
ncbi:MAG: hypothetical protein HYZ31_12040 [Gammaproteobacteria bacterium]|nr:hypothetical protein [Gammaproteobacteria bacterium]